MIKISEIYQGTWTISAPCQNGFNMQVEMHGKNQTYEIRTGEYPGQVSNFFDQYFDAHMTVHCYYDQSTRAIVNDMKDWITNLFFFREIICMKFITYWLCRQELWISWSPKKWRRENHFHVTRRIYSKSYDQMMIEWIHNGTGKKFTAYFKRTAWECTVVGPIKLPTLFSCF